jgi:hypothetical protein
MSKANIPTNKRRAIKRTADIETITKKVIITGTGRAGTSVLMWLFTELGLDTGFTIDECEAINSTTWKAGLEKMDLVHGPYIVKNPQLAHQIDKVHENVEYAIIPVRDLIAAAQSRVNNGDGRGGLWEATDLDTQIKYLEEVSSKMFSDLDKFSIPYVTVEFPEFTSDPKYCYERLSYVLSDIKYDTFLAAHNKIMDIDISGRTKV